MVLSHATYALIYHFWNLCFVNTCMWFSVMPMQFTYALIYHFLEVMIVLFTCCGSSMILAVIFICCGSPYDIPMQNIVYLRIAQLDACGSHSHS